MKNLGPFIIFIPIMIGSGFGKLLWVPLTKFLTQQHRRALVMVLALSTTWTSLIVCRDIMLYHVISTCNIYIYIYIYHQQKIRQPLWSLFHFPTLFDPAGWPVAVGAPGGRSSWIASVLERLMTSTAPRATLRATSRSARGQGAPPVEWPTTKRRGSRISNSI